MPRYRKPAQATTSLVVRLHTLNVVNGVTWDKIALLDDFHDIPPGTLNDIYHSGKVPAKWRARLLPPVVAERVAVHKTDMTSAARTLVNNLPEDKVKELIKLLMAKFATEEPT